MKEQLTTFQLANKLDKDRFNKHDFIADTRQIEVYDNPDVNDRSIRLTVQGDETHYNLNNHMHAQIATKLKIPRAYYDRLRLTHPDLLATNINKLFSREHERRMIRTLDGTARAI